MTATGRIARRVEGALRALHVVLILTFAGISAAPELERALPPLMPAGVSVAAYVATTTLLALRAARSPSARGSWAWVAFGFACYTAGSTYSWVATWDGTPLGFPSLADLGWLIAYPFIYAGILGLIRIGSANGVMRLDGAVAGVGGAAIFSAIVVDLLSGRGHITSFAGAVSLCYPLADALLIGTLFCQFAVGTWRGRPDLMLFTGGITAVAIADTGYVLYGSYQPGSWVDIGYALAMGIVGVSTWALGSGPGDERNRPGTVRIGLASACAAGALIILIAASPADIGLSVPSIVLASATLLLVLVRFQLSFRELRAVGEARHAEARRDPLTGLANRRGFLEYFDRPHSGPVAGLLLDLDRFKQVNDSFGHEAGDELLRQAAARLRANVRDSDLLARLGGDEFAIVCRSTGPDDLATLAGRVREELCRPFDVIGIPIEIDVSIGIAVSEAGDTSADALLRHADLAMYTAKRAGGGHAFYRAHDDEAARRHLELAQDLRRDVGTAAMVLHYQPKLDLHTDAVSAVEALVRWQRPSGDLLYPDAFLPIVEETGLMTALTRNVLTQAMDQCRDWRAAGLKLAVAVNVSATDLESPGFADLVIGVLRERGLPATALTLEITETTAMENSERAHRTVRELHHVGIKVSIDDYGTDHSTLAHLHRLLVAGELKLDRRFVTHLETEERSSVIVRSSIQLAHALGMAVVAEGVENERSLDLLRGWGCDVAQGYFISRPQPAANVTEWLEASRGYGTTRSSSTPTPGPSPVPPPSRR